MSLRGGPHDPGSGARPAPGSGGVDRAALLGTAMAAVVALTFGAQGEWDWLAACAGLALLAVLAAFFRLPAGKSPRDVDAELAALAAVTALAGVLVVAAPLQAVLAAGTAEGRECRAAGAVAAAVVHEDPVHVAAAARAAPLLGGDEPVGAEQVLAGAAADAGRNVEGVCLGAITSRVLWAPALLIAVAVFAVARWRLRRRPGA